MTQYMQEAGAMKQLTDAEIEDAVFSVLRKWNINRATGLHPELLEIIRAVLAAALPPAAVQAWIPVTERLPEPWKEVFVWPEPSDQTNTAELRSDGKWEWAQYVTHHGWETVVMSTPPTHWRPKFAPPPAANEGTLTAGKQGGDGVKGDRNA